MRDLVTICGMQDCEVDYQEQLTNNRIAEESLVQLVEHQGYYKEEMDINICRIKQLEGIR